MSATTVYEMCVLSKYKNPTDDITFVLALTPESRSKTALISISKRIEIKNMIVIRYSKTEPTEWIYKDFLGANIILLDIIHDPMELILQLNGIEPIIWEQKIILDISCLRVPEMFTIIKYFKVAIEKYEFDIMYSLPYDYNFTNEPFTSYKSYSGEITLYEPIGFSGSSDVTMQSPELFLFMGFEGALSLKVIESGEYSNVNLVNNLPAFYIKYKDIAILNNYQITSNHQNMFYTPSDNPFETYNLLKSKIENLDMMCIAPLSSKAVSLGICLFAIDNEDKVKVIYPISNSYEEYNTIDAYETFVYHISLA